MRKIQINWPKQTIYPSMNAASKALGVSFQTIVNWVANEHVGTSNIEIKELVYNENPTEIDKIKNIYKKGE